MIGGKKKVDLTKEYILSTRTPFEIYKTFCPVPFRLNQAFSSPFRRDEVPSFVIHYKGGEYYHIDYADSNYRGDCFDFVKQVCNKGNFNDVLVEIERGIPESRKASYPSKGDDSKPLALTVVPKRFTAEELRYWNEYHQSLDDLKSLDIYSPKSIYRNGSRLPMNENDLTFCFLFEEKYWKIYRPFCDMKKDTPIYRRKWDTNAPLTTTYGKHHLFWENKAIITKSVKDMAVIRKIYSEVMGVQSENAACFSKELLSFLVDNSQERYVAFDADEAGKKNSWVLTNDFGFKHINTPDYLLGEGIKDFAEWGRVKGLKEIEEHFKLKNIL